MTVVYVFCNDTATTEIYTLSLHDALPIYGRARRHHRERRARAHPGGPGLRVAGRPAVGGHGLRAHVRRLLAARREAGRRSEEHTSELQSRQYLVCRLLLEKKNPLGPARTF